MKTILILAANPTTVQLQLDEEVRNIRAALERSKDRDRLPILTFALLSMEIRSDFGFWSESRLKTEYPVLDWGTAVHFYVVHDLDSNRYNEYRFDVHVIPVERHPGTNPYRCFTMTGVVFFSKPLSWGRGDRLRHFAIVLKRVRCLPNTSISMPCDILLCHSSSKLILERIDCEMGSAGLSAGAETNRFQGTPGRRSKQRL